MKTSEACDGLLWISEWARISCVVLQDDDVPVQIKHHGRARCGQQAELTRRDNRLVSERRWVVQRVGVVVVAVEAVAPLLREEVVGRDEDRGQWIRFLRLARRALGLLGDVAHQGDAAQGAEVESAVGVDVHLAGDRVERPSVPDVGAEDLVACLPVVGA